jgi:hypothetical protein
MEPRTALQAACDAGDYRVFVNSQGKVTIRGGGVFETPTVHLTPDEIISFEGAVRSEGVYTRSNDVVPKYAPPELKYEMVEAASVRDQDSVDLVGGVISQVLDLPFVSSHDQARHLAKIQLNEKKTRWRIANLTCNISALRAADSDTVTLTLPQIGITAKTFRIVRREVDDTFTFVKFELLDWTQVDYDWLTGDCIAPPALPKDTEESAYLIEPPQGLNMTIAGAVGSASTLNVAWDNYGYVSGFKIVIGYRVYGTSTWSYVTVDPSTNSTSFAGAIPALPAGIVYETFAQFITAPNHYGGGQTSIKITPPAPVQSLTWTDDTANNEIDLQWSQPTTPEFHQTKVFKKQTDDLSTATLIETVTDAGGSFVNRSTTTTGFSRPFYIWLRTEKADGSFTPANITKLTIT